MAKKKDVKNLRRDGDLQPKAMKQGKRVKKNKQVKKDDNLKRGQADSLTGTAWSAWMSHVARVGPMWLFIIFTMCHLLCCRVTEILQMQLQDVDYENNRINVKALKRRGAIMKPISATLRRFLDKWKNDGGVSFSYTRKWGKMASEPLKTGGTTQLPQSSTSSPRSGQTTSWDGCLRTMVRIYVLTLGRMDDQN